MDKSNLNNLNNTASNTAPSKRSLMSNITNLMIVACIDGQVTDEEKRLIANIAQSYGLSQEEFVECGRRCDECLQKNQLPIDVPESDDAKIGFIINLVVTMLGVIIVIQAVLDRRSPDVFAEVVVPTGHEQHII